MPNGGKRPGAGRKRGVPNKATLTRQNEIAATGITPLDYMISVLRDEGLPLDTRFDAAKAAAPFVHPKLSSIEASGKDGKPLIPEGITVSFVKPGDAS
jgi:hypothetical protein